MGGRVAICLGYRDWHLDHLVRCLRSLTPAIAQGVRAVVADLGSTPSLREQLAGRMGLPPVRLVEVGAEEWSRSVALNRAAAAAGRVETLVFTDADMLFPASWFRACEVALATDPAAVWLTDSRDLPQQWMEWLVPEYREADLRGISQPHPRVGQGAAMVVPRAWFERVGGFDEYYAVWGAEDNDLVQRAEWDGRRVAWLPDAWVAHQWHRRDWPTVAQYEQVQRNRAYLAARIAARGPIVRNGAVVAQKP